MSRKQSKLPRVYVLISIQKQYVIDHNWFTGDVNSQCLAGNVIQKTKKHHHTVVSASPGKIFTIINCQKLIGASRMTMSIENCYLLYLNQLNGKKIMQD